MASGQLAATIGSWKPPTTDAARGTSFVDGSTPPMHHHVYQFGGSGGAGSNQYVGFSGVIEPLLYSGNGFYVKGYAAANTTANASVLQVAFRKQNTAEAFDSTHVWSYKTVTINWPGTAKLPQLFSIELLNTEIDGLAAGDYYDAQFLRDYSHGSDSYTGELLLLFDSIYIVER